MTAMRLAKRTRKRGALDKALGLARARAARLAASPPLPSRYAVDPRASEHVREGEPGWVLVDCDASTGGTYQMLEEARAASETHGADRDRFVAADLFLHEAQLRRARHAGADAALLVARVLTLDRLDALTKAARGLGLAVAIEVRDVSELAAATAVGADAVRVAEVDRDTRRPAADAPAVVSAARAACIPLLVACDHRKLPFDDGRG